jgi:hypothetical protein
MFFQNCRVVIQCIFYLLSLRNKGKVVAKGKLVTNNATQDIGGLMLGKGILYVERLENVDIRNKGDELIPRPMFEIHTLTDAIGYIIPWPRSHVSFFSKINHVFVIFLSCVSSNLVPRCW